MKSPANPSSHCSTKPLIVLLLLSLVIGMQPAVYAQDANGTGQTANLAPALPIGAGDLLDVNVFDTPELSGKYRVSEKGVLALAVGGSLPVAGLTVDQVASAIEERLRSTQVMHDPHVSVMVLEYATQGATVLGEVAKPGIYPLLGPQGLFDVISAAGGLTETAGAAVSITHRSDPQHPAIVRLLKGSPTTESNVPVLPGDTIVVSRAGLIYVVGAVTRPGGFLLKTDNEQQLTVLQALALAQGTTAQASLGSASLIRTTSKGREQIPINLKHILANKSTDPELQENDILFVPASGTKNAMYKGLDTAIRIATGVAIYTR